MLGEVNVRVLLPVTSKRCFDVICDVVKADKPLLLVLDAFREYGSRLDL